MKQLLEPSVLLVILGTSILGSSAAVVGAFSFLRKRSLLGDALSHAVLPGVCMAFIISGTKNPYWLLAGATLSGWLSLLLMDLITRKTRIKPDAATGIILSVFFGIGILLLTWIQRSGDAAQSGLDSFLFGKAASMNRTDVLVFSGFSVLLMFIVILLYKELKLITFNRDFAISAGLPVKLLEFILSTLLVIAVATGIQAVGVVLMAALLITPATAARFWTSGLSALLILSAVFGALSGLGGSVISLMAPAMPTGPWIVVLLTVFAAFSILFAPGKGLWSRNRLAVKNREKVLTENILKIFYRLGENKPDFYRHRNTAELLASEKVGHQQLQQGLKVLIRNKLVDKLGRDYFLTDEGLTEAKRVVRLHRLWEKYLSVRLQLPGDHVHFDAEAIEHIITPELELLLQDDLSYPEYDPHNNPIPK